MALLSFAFQKLPAHIFYFLTELQNTIFYAIALRPLLLCGNITFCRISGVQLFNAMPDALT